MAWVAAIAQVGGGIVSAASTFSAGQQTYEQSLNEAAIERKDMFANLDQANRAEFIRQSTERANVGASGGTAAGFLDAIMDNARQGELQKQNILYGGQMEQAKTRMAGIESFRKAAGAASSELIGGVSQAGSTLASNRGGGSSGGTAPTTNVTRNGSIDRSVVPSF